MSQDDEILGRARQARNDRIDRMHEDRLWKAQKAHSGQDGAQLIQGIFSLLFKFAVGSPKTFVVTVIIGIIAFFIWKHSTS